MATIVLYDGAIALGRFSRKDWLNDRRDADLTEEQSKILNILFTIYFAFYCLLLGFSVFNTVKFVLPKISIRLP